MRTSCIIWNAEFIIAKQELFKEDEEKVRRIGKMQSHEFKNSNMSAVIIVGSGVCG